MKKIAITSGDPAGIGPEIIGKGLRFFPLSEQTAYIIYGQLDIPADYQYLYSSDELTGTFKDRNTIIAINDPDEISKPGQIYHIDISLPDVVKGKPSAETGKTALAILDRCTADAINRKIDAILTAPVSKEHIRLHDSNFIGHTEFLAAKFSCDDYVMNFTGDYFSLALLTTHCSLASVRDFITPDFIIPKLRTISRYVKGLEGTSRIAMLSVNPHCGEGGAFGDEDKTLKEILAVANQEGIIIDGPFPADSFFKYHLQEYSQVIAVYHDQGLIPFKLINGESGVNTTLGLPIVRTSVDHGTAFDIAAKNIASPVSFINALKTAEIMLGLDEERHTSYRSFASYYDDYMSHVEWDEWLDFIITRCSEFIPFLRRQDSTPNKQLQVLDIGCGTGLMADKLTRSGYHVDGIDVSPEMLETASQKNDKMTLTLGDFQSELPEENYHLLTSLFDTVNYITQKHELVAFFGSVYRSLRDGGLFIFDVSTVFNCEENFNDTIYTDETEDSHLTVKSSYQDFIQHLEIDLFVKRGLIWTHSFESQQLRIYKIKDLVDLLAENKNFILKGLYSLDGFRKLSGKNLQNIDNTAERVFFVLQKQTS